jgi:UDP-N-acetyl-D-glucosamine/UDP-N-acetyl-D-galactosamine dehydrogenase
VKEDNEMAEKIAIVGLGYVGLPVALAFAKKFEHSVGFDINVAKVRALNDGVDGTGEVESSVLKSTSLKMTADADDLRQATFYVVAVPTPIDSNNRPDLTPVLKASEAVGKVLKKGDVVVYESTVYPGVTEDVCGPLLSKVSGLKRSDFFLGYSPERINPGDKLHTLERIVKVVSGEDEATLERVAKTYAAIIDAGVFRASSIKVAEAAKVIENTQRDLNIALMNELALIFDRMNIRTRDVLAAAGTKWNFLPFTPGLVGGHCIGVDPYYLTAKAEELGYQSQVILAGRRINNSMGPYVAQRTVKLLIHNNVAVRTARVGVMGLTFKENVADIRNSKVPDIVTELKEFGVAAMIYDPFADAAETQHEYNLSLSALDEMTSLDAMVLAVAHRQFVDQPLERLLARVKKGGVVVDVKSALQPDAVKALGYQYWCL